MIIRPYRPEDESLLLEWRNSEAHRRWSFSNAPIDALDHKNWFAAFLADPAKIGFIGEDETGRPLGYVRFEPTEFLGTLRVSIGVAPNLLGKGIGSELLQKAVEMPEIASRAFLLKAETFLENVASKRIFEKSGFLNLGGREAFGRKYNLLMKAVGDGLSGFRFNLKTVGGTFDENDILYILSYIKAEPVCIENLRQKAQFTDKPFFILAESVNDVVNSRCSSFNAIVVSNAERGITVLGKPLFEIPKAAFTLCGLAVDKLLVLLAWAKKTGENL